MATSAQFRKLYDDLFGVYGELPCPLNYRTVFQLLCAIMLSAQCRDERVNMITKELFKIAPDPEAMAALEVGKIAEIIKPCGIYRNKSVNLSNCAKMLLSKFGGEVPRSMEELTQLPGIGRKSANAILGNGFGIPGFPVDTHVIRVLSRLGYAANVDPAKIEAQVVAKTPPKMWTNFSHLIIAHGRRICHAGKHPECETCILSDRCSYFRNHNGLL
ncbi:MAG: endonuclease III [Victivallales bacterium]|jgi:endonuclease-3|nr:endonuclease III [Victivallales bacterium]